MGVFMDLRFKFWKIELLQEDLKLRDVVCYGRDILKFV